MLGFAWLTLRQAQEALKNGRLEEALRLLEQPAARSHRKTHQLVVQLARRFVERGERCLDLDDAEGSWRDLLQAEALGTGEKTGDRLRQTLTGLGMAELRALLQAGDTTRAEEALAHLRQRRVRSAELQVLEQGLRAWSHARELAQRGEFGLALEASEPAARLLGINPRFKAFQSELERQKTAFPELLVRLHEVAEAERWREVIECVEQVLSAAPRHAEARALRIRAWRAIEPAVVQNSVTDEDANGPVDPLPARFLLWIDGVGGYLVCLGHRLTFGQGLADARVDVPLVADLSRLHATLSRDAEGYVMEAVRPIQVNGATVTRGLLQPGDRVTLGSTCQFLFRLPVPGNSTARLDLVSGHRLPTAVDAVLLMAETLVLGPGPQAHVVAPDLSQPMILFRHRNGLGLRYEGELRVNGQKCTGRTILGPCAAVSTDEVTFAIEPTS